MMIYLAPIQGTTDRIFRNIFPLYFKGVDLAIAPFISSSGRRRPEQVLLREFYPGQNTGLPTIPQILSSDPDDFLMLAHALYDIGCGTVNWNLGCPFPMVINKGKGAGMLCYPLKVESFLEKTFSSLKPKLSIKLRIGLEYPEEILQLIPIFNRYPIEELIIHPRTGRQMYEGEVDLDMFGRCLELSKHRIVYNGDIDSAEKYGTLAKRFARVERWMIGRGLLRDPFLAEKITSNTGKTYPEQVKILRAFHDHLLEEYSKILYGPAHLTDRMKGIWTYLGGFFENGKKLQKKIKKTHGLDNYVDVVNRIFEELSRQQGDVISRVVKTKTS